MSERNQAHRGIEYFESLQHLEGRRFSSLETAYRLLAALGNPQDQVPSVHVAGTNGKGTVCALIASMLHAQGYNVGQTSSPHLSHVTERCIVNGEAVSSGDYSAAIETVMAAADREQLVPGYFVLGVVAAFYEFARRKLDWMVVEVGLGGLLDGTNTISKPRATLITSISADHTDLLGKTDEEIARNKAGIAKPGVPMFVGEVSGEAKASIERITAEVGAPTECFGHDFFYDAESDRLTIGSQVFDAHLRAMSLDGAHQQRNAALAVRTAIALDIGETARADGIRRTRWPGRLERFELRRADGSGVQALIDVAHNPGGMEVLLQYLEKPQGDEIREWIFIVSIVARKDWHEILRQLRGFAEKHQGACQWVFTSSENPDAVPPADLRAFFGSGVAEQDPEQALKTAASLSGPKSLVVITGSVFLAGRVRPLVISEPFRTIAPDGE
ncbi:MAG: folylpolyglutamate synthase/dihydrofolate synthase family protein [Bdellovibrionota bacterium]